MVSQNQQTLHERLKGLEEEDYEEYGNGHEEGYDEELEDLDDLEDLDEEEDVPGHYMKRRKSVGDEDDDDLEDEEDLDDDYDEDLEDDEDFFDDEDLYDDEEDDFDEVEDERDY